ncbi:MAG: hypothetical protein ABW003_16100 [Microvirga sp.]
MERALLALVFSVTAGAASALATEPSLDIERECRLISESDLHGCTCLGRYFVTKFGRDEGAAALHLVERSFVPEPRISVSILYERFGADKLDRVARRILETHDEAVTSCPISAHIAE